MPSYAIDGVIPVVDPAAFVHPTAVLIGDVVIEADCYIGPFAVLRGDFGQVIVKTGANVQDTCVLHTFPNRDCVIEENGHVGHGAILHGCSIGPDALIGINAVILDDARIARESIVAASSLVTSGFSCSPRSLIVGSPARVVRSVEASEVAWKAEGTKLYQTLAQRSLGTMREVEPLPGLETEGRRITTEALKLKKDL